jgi:arylsulfatase A-like enzyme
MIIRWPGKTTPGGVDQKLHYQIDILPTFAEAFGIDASDRWDGASYAACLAEPGAAGHDALVVSQMAWSCQRTVRWTDWLLIRTYHTGLKPYPPVMLFNVADDPHELEDLAEAKPEVVNEGLAILEKWYADQMATSASGVDPLQIILREGGPHHTRYTVEKYCQRLRDTGREQYCATLLAERDRLKQAGADPKLV